MIDSIETQRKTGQERFLGMDHSLLEYWVWAHSDIASNAERGKLAEYIVSCALHAPSPCRTEWDAVDVISADGIKVEVKSSAFLQTWKQHKLSTIQFDIAPKKAWDAETNLYSKTKCRSADVYVFCLFASKDAKNANPLDLHQWEFYVLPTCILDKQVPLQKRISLPSLISLGAEKAMFSELYAAVKSAVNTVPVP
ncbi:MAG: hypothetical protein PUH00_05160 [Clostridiales bacterium]|nr:hypothetical protein [Clostridiales bacterium]MDY3992998.1 hypothetical protein [Evtepia sp.]